MAKIIDSGITRKFVTLKFSKKEVADINKFMEVHPYSSITGLCKEGLLRLIRNDKSVQDSDNNFSLD